LRIIELLGKHQAVSASTLTLVTTHSTLCQPVLISYPQMLALAVSVPRVVADHDALAIGLAVFAAGAALLSAHCVIDAVRRRTWLPVLVIAGGVISLPIEPFWDVNVLFTFASNSHPIALTAFGRRIPLFVAFAYPAFIGWGSYIAYRLIKAGKSARALLVLPAAFFLADATIEIVGTRLHLWLYYGQQPFTVAKWPMLYGALNGTITLLGGALIAVLEPRLTGFRRPLIVLAVPSAYVGIYAIAGWPMWAALNARVSRPVEWLAGAASLGICVLVAQLTAETCGRNATAREGRNLAVQRVSDPAGAPARAVQA
jgi:hypothetical protein